MTMNHRTIALSATAISLAVLGTVGMAFSSIEPQDIPGFSPRAEALGRPMDDHGPDSSYGDLSVFDAISEIGPDQGYDQPYCDDHAALATRLAQDFGEHARVKSPLAGNRSVALWASDAQGTWTALYTRADGVSCVVSSGMGWESGANPLALLKSEGLLNAG
ncbi:hypothetical protein [Rhodobacter maris]|uniref:Uncharacterized protein n=1 Tax=Rhodobacter maris TaxID=446682 RepID=A0A285SFY8_9RHOB|nr:hypothetical protein [Rhodobacter maris]SOC06595.1 hypothetical protein SAMN05877831_10558 [Rhodobacter maris]